MKILFLNNVHKACGVYQYGIRLFEAINSFETLNAHESLTPCIYKEVSDEKDYLKIVEEIKPNKIIYNYHVFTMAWLNKSNIYKESKNVGIPHEASVELFDEILDIDPLKPNGIPRPIYYTIPTKIMNNNYETFINYNKGPDVKIFGSFGFGFKNKGFDKIIKYVNEQYDEAIIKFIIPLGHYCLENELNQTILKCFEIKRKPGIELMVSTDFFENNDLLYFLNSNTMNIFLYDKMEGRGISSTIDYALSVNVPIGISDSCMFRNIYDDSICLYKNKISDIMKVSLTYMKKYREMYSQKNIYYKVIGELPNTKINIPISIGELVDKYSILEIKNRLISDLQKKPDVLKEIKSLDCSKKYIDAYPRFYNQLVYINQKIWEFTDEIKKTKKDDYEKYSNISHDIFSFNQKRFRLKKYFNDLNNSEIKEQKSYAEDACVLIGKNMAEKIDTIEFLCIEYDVVYARVENENEKIAIRRILPNPNLHLFIGQGPPYKIIDLDQSVFDIPSVFRQLNIPQRECLPSAKPIYYTAPGLLGDFLLQLSVVCENYYKTGRKGIVNMIDTDIIFRKGIQETYNDIQAVVKSQPYIEDLRIGMPESFDIHLGSWRYSEQLFKINMCELFLQEYDIHMGKHKWIETIFDPQWKSKVVIHITPYRFPDNINYSDIVNQYGIENVVFLNMEPSEYEYFFEKTGIQIPNVHKPQSFEEICVIINSCKLFVGGCSMPMCIAHATYAERIVGLPPNPDDKRLSIGIKNHIPNIIAEL